MGVVQLKELDGFQPLAEISKLDQQQDFAPYVGDLATRFRVNIPQGGRVKAPATTAASVIVENLARTNLTELFANQYNVGIDSLTQGKNILRLYGKTYDPPGPEDELTLLYQIYDEEETEEAAKGRVKTFWQLVANGTSGSVIMRCLRDLPDEEPPLQGAGNIAFIPGVEEALVADVDMLYGILLERRKGQKP